MSNRVLITFCSAFGASIGLAAITDAIFGDGWWVLAAFAVTFVLIGTSTWKRHAND